MPARPDSYMTRSARAAAATGIHGIDVASRGLDKLDRDALHFALDCEASALAAIDLGCGRGVQSVRFAALGWRVWMYDLLDIQDSVARWNELLGDRLTFVCKDVRRLTREDLPVAAQLLYSQRFLHHLTFADACDAVCAFAALLASGGRAYLSASGLNGELGEGYPHASRLVRARFAKLTPETAAKHEILGPVCLYEEADLAALAARAGLTTLSVTRTTFGNIKGVFEKP